MHFATAALVVSVFYAECYAAAAMMAGFIYFSVYAETSEETTVDE